MACKLRQYLLSKSNLAQTYHLRTQNNSKNGKVTLRNNNSVNEQTGSVRTISHLSSEAVSNGDIGNGSKKYWSLPASLKRRNLRFSSVRLMPCENEHVNALTYETLVEYTLDTLSDLIDDVICQYGDQIDTDVSLHVSTLNYLNSLKETLVLLIEW